MRGTVQRNRLGKGFALGKELLFSVAAEKSDVAGFSVVILVVEAALGDGDAANFGEWRQCADNVKITVVEEAMHLDVVAKFRHDVLAGRRFLRDLDIVLLSPADNAARTRPSGLHAGAARKNDHHVFAKSFLVILNALAKPFARRDHHGYGDHSPGDPEHRQHLAPLCPPAGRQPVSHYFLYSHGSPPPP